MHFLPDSDDPWAIAGSLTAALPPGSYLAVSHATPESLVGPDSRDQLSAVYAQTTSGGVTPRPKKDIERFFAGLEMTSPGMVNITGWRPESGSGQTRTLFYGGVAGKKG